MEKKYQLPKEFAEKWIKALRSGDYEQGVFRLKDEHGCYCCLGVAGAMNGIHEFGDKQFYNSCEFSLDIEDGLIPEALYGGSGNELVNTLTDKNDTGETFDSIADWIEENVEFV